MAGLKVNHFALHRSAAYRLKLGISAAFVLAVCAPWLLVVFFWSQQTTDPLILANLILFGELLQLGVTAGLLGLIWAVAVPQWVETLIARHWAKATFFLLVLFPASFVLIWLIF